MRWALCIRRCSIAKCARGTRTALIAQAIIVLREELDFFVIPSAAEATTDADGTASASLNAIKRECGGHLLERRSIFTALQRNVAREGNAAEQHLIDMLCMSGFHRDDEWGYRAVEPGRCCITSIALVLLKTGISHPPRTPGESNPTDLPSPGGSRPGVTVNAAQLATASKLLRALDGLSELTCQSSIASRRASGQHRAHGAADRRAAGGTRSSWTSPPSRSSPRKSKTLHPQTRSDRSRSGLAACGLLVRPPRSANLTCAELSIL